MYLLWYSAVVQREQPLRVVFFRTETGNEPVREWLKGLSKEEKKVIGEDVKTVQFTWPIGKPLVDNLGEQIWEVRSRLRNRIARTLFTVHDQEIVLLHGFIKKDRKTPLEDLRLAKKRSSLYRSGHE
jgi:phage-related protein